MCDGIGEQLLADVKEVFLGLNVSRVSSADLVKHLTSREDWPWAEFQRGDKPLSAQNLAKRLRRFDIKSQQLKIDGKNVRGYVQEDFAEAFERYLSAGSPDLAATLLPAASDAAVSSIAGATRPATGSGYAHEATTVKPTSAVESSGVAARPEAPDGGEAAAQLDLNDRFTEEPV